MIRLRWLSLRPRLSPAICALSLIFCAPHYCYSLSVGLTSVTDDLSLRQQAVARGRLVMLSGQRVHQAAQIKQRVCWARIIVLWFGFDYIVLHLLGFSTVYSIWAVFSYMTSLYMLFLNYFFKIRCRNLDVLQIAYSDILKYGSRTV